jgi:hypothetical protein
MAEPIDMVLHCPACGLQHIDEPCIEAVYLARAGVTCASVPDAPHGLQWSDGKVRPYPWNNPAHRSHMCEGCGHTWRPADVATNGVAAVKTSGKADSPRVDPREAVSALRDLLDVMTGRATGEMAAIANATLVVDRAGGGR